MSLESIQHLVQNELQEVDKAIASQLNANVFFIKKLSQYIINSGGKRLRPLLVLLGAKACNYRGDKHINLAVAMEYFHTATLLHDDVIDESSLRRGKRTANHIWGSKASILVGDFLFTRSFQLLADVENIKVITVLANVSNTITRGEVLQLINCNDPQITEQQYMDVIKNKTASLFSAAAQIGSILAESSAQQTENMASYGLHLGNAFQLIDDALDYCSNTETMGKNIGDDLAEGKPTLPLIYALHHAEPKTQKIIRNAIENASLENLTQIQKAIESTNAIAYTHEVARKQIDIAITALENIPHSQFKDALIRLAQFAVERQH